MIQFEIERTHSTGGDWARCTNEECPADHAWSVYERRLDRFGEGFAHWQSDHVTLDRAEQAAYIYALMLAPVEQKLLN